MSGCGCELPWLQPDPVQCGGHGYWYALTRYTDPDAGTSWLGWARIPEVDKEHAQIGGATCACGGWWNEHHVADQQAAEERIYRKSQIEGTETA